MASKRHHFVPEVYLKRFSDSTGKVFGYRKDDPTKPLYQVPRELGHERYYYAQPMPDGGVDTDRLEQLFSKVESVWDPIVEKGLARVEFDVEDTEELITFLALMRARGPAMRDAIEVYLAKAARLTLEHMEATNQLPPMDNIPLALREQLKPENLRISIDPHRSIWAMPKVIEGIALVVDQLGFRLIHNETGVDFITSDNPVAYFEPGRSDRSLLPYAVRPGRPIELLFPITPRLLLVGHTDFLDRYLERGISHAVLRDQKMVKRVNRHTARFGYRLVFASHRGHEALIQKYAHESPVPAFHAEARDGGRILMSQMVFGPRPSKVKWAGSRPAEAPIRLDPE